MNYFIRILVCLPLLSLALGTLSCETFPNQAEGKNVEEFIESVEKPILLPSSPPPFYLSIFGPKFGLIEVPYSQAQFESNDSILYTVRLSPLLIDLPPPHLS